MPAPNIGTGSTATFATSSWAANIISIDWSGISRESINTSHMGTTSDHTFMPADLVDNGELTIELQFAGDDVPPIMTNGAAETVTIDIAGEGTSYDWSASMFQTGFSWNAPLEELMTATATFKVTGAVTT